MNEQAVAIRSFLMNGPFADAVTSARVVAGRGSLAGRSWVRAELARPATDVTHVHLLPWRLDLDPVSGNEHEHPGELQLVGCERINGRYGPGVRIEGSFATRDVSRFEPRLLMRSGRTRALRWEDCIINDEPTAAFTKIVDRVLRRYSLPERSARK